MLSVGHSPPSSKSPITTSNNSDALNIDYDSASDDMEVDSEPGTPTRPQDADLDADGESVGDDPIPSVAPSAGYGRDSVCGSVQVLFDQLLIANRLHRSWKKTP
jgi:hypothetical protein